MAKKRKPASRTRRHKSRDQIDLTALLNEPVRVSKGGRPQPMTPFEIGLRAQVKKAVTENNLSAIRSVIAMAVKHGLTLPPPEAPRIGGVLVVPGRLTKESWAALFKKPDAEDEPGDKAKEPSPEPATANAPINPRKTSDE